MLRLILGNSIVIFLLAPSAVLAQSCPDLTTGGLVAEPFSIASTGGVLRADLTFRTSVDAYGLRRYCYLYNDSIPSPTLRLHPGDELVLRLRNALPESGDLSAPSDPAWPHTHSMEIHGICGGGKLYAASTNLHFHGVHAPPVCHQDDVLSTLIEPNGGWYEYRLRIPPSQTPGLYWYHPHPHGFSERQVLGGASGAIVIEGAAPQPLAAEAFPRLIVLRDRVHPGGEENEDVVPARDVSINGVPVLYPMNRPARLAAQPGRREFWRVLNASADTYFDLQLRAGPDIHNTPYAVHFDIIGRDGWPTAPQSATHVLIPPGGRAEFLVTMPPDSVFAQFVTDGYDTGPAGEATPFRVLANIEWQGPPAARPAPAKPIATLGPADLSAERPARQRKLYFSETHEDPGNYLSAATYYITVEGETPRAFDMSSTKPNLVVRHGTVEDWTVENRAPEAHNFHIHQLHFQVLERDGKPVTEPGLRDTIDLPYWDGKSNYPSVKLRMDFRSPDIVGTFLYHCHILEHEDGGMMGTIEVR